MVNEMEAYLPLSSQKLACASAATVDTSVSSISIPAACELEVCVEDLECDTELGHAVHI